MPVIVYILLVSSLACAAMGLFPSLSFVTGIIWGVSLVIGGYFLNRRHLLMILGLNILLLYGLAGSSILFWLLVFGIPSFIMGLLLADQKGYYELQKWGIFVAVLLTSLFVGLTYDSVKNLSANYIQTEFDQYLSQNGSLLSMYEEQGVTREEIINSLEEATNWIVMHLPAFYYLQAILAVYLVLLFSSYISQKNKFPILLRKPFREEKMPWQFAWVVIIALSLWLWGRDDMGNPYYIGSNIMLVAAPVTAYYGLSVLAYQWSRIPRRPRRWLAGLFVIIMLLLPLPFIFFIILLGLFDSLLDYRKLDQKKEVMK